MKNDLQHLELLQTVLDKLALCGVPLENMEIAGGAVRDMLLEKPIKDIDVFFEGKFDEELIKKHFIVLKKEPDEEEWYREFENKTTKEETWVVDYQRLSLEGCEYPIQLIRTKEICAQIKTFGCNLSKVAYGSGGLFLSNEFLTDQYLKILTFTDTCTENYSKRMQNKFPEYAVNGEQNKNWNDF